MCVRRVASRYFFTLSLLRQEVVVQLASKGRKRRGLQEILENIGFRNMWSCFCTQRKMNKICPSVIALKIFIQYNVIKLDKKMFGFAIQVNIVKHHQEINSVYFLVAECLHMSKFIVIKMKFFFSFQ